MARLAELQRLFAEALLDEHAGRGIEMHLADGAEVVQETLKNHRSGTKSARVHALSDTYPVCVRLVGKRYFRQIAWYYSERHPASYPCLGLYGEAFAAFLDNVVQVRPEAQEFPHLPDIARLEWAWRECVWAPINDNFNIAALATVDSAAHPSVVLELLPSVRLVQSTFPIYSIWQAHRLGKYPNDPHMRGPERVFVWTKDGAPSATTVDLDTWQLLMAIRNGATLSELSNLHNDCSNIPLRLTEMIQRGWITSFRQRLHGAHKKVSNAA
jgi:hypothetical protein